MIYRALADAILIVHLAFVAFVVFGALAVVRWPRVAWLHVPAGVWGIMIEYGGSICPLTPLEIALRRRGGQVGYAGGFIEHYVTAVVYPEGLTRRTQLMLGSVALGVNLLVYAHIVSRRRRQTHACPS